MIGLLLKNKGLFFDIILVVGGILAFTFWDPLGIFNNTKLRATANMVTGVRDIGQLVTAEYYGEVISSWKEFKLTEFPEDTISYKAEDLFVNLKFALSDPNKKFRKLDTKKIQKELHNKYGEKFYYKFLTFLGEELGFKLNKIFDEKDSDLKRNYENKIWRKLHNEIAITHKTLKKKYKHADGSLIDKEYANYLSEVPEFIEGFYKYYGFLTKKHLESGSNKRKEIVFIGRGWVKAGFDFGKLNEGNFMYDEANKSVHFFGIKPVILDTDINPWFIPERKVKGFELVNFSGKVNFEDAKAVKKQCKEKLLEQARKADIVKKAMENGEETLKNFFSLILDEPDIKVRFHTHPFDLQYAMIAADTLIDINEAILIQSLYQSELKKLSVPVSEDFASMKIKREQLLQYFINQLKELYFLEKGQSFNFYSMYAAQILKDTFNVSLSDRQLLIELRDTLKIDKEDSLNVTTSVVTENKVWFQDCNFRYEFNQAMRLINKEALSFEVIDTCGQDIQNPKRIGDTLLVKDKMEIILDTFKINEEDFCVFSFSDTVVKPANFFDAVQYDMNYTQLLNDTITNIDTIAKILNGYKNTKKYSRSFDTLNRAEMQVIIEVEKNNILYKNSANPIGNLVAGVENFLERIKKK
jgi:hypothetical protein